MVGFPVSRAQCEEGLLFLHLDQSGIILLTIEGTEILLRLSPVRDSSILVRREGEKVSLGASSNCPDAVPFARDYQTAVWVPDAQFHRWS
jgi:hypothetical protein